MHTQKRASELKPGNFFSGNTGGSVWKVVQTTPTIKAMVWCNHTNMRDTLTLNPDNVVVLITEAEARAHIEHDAYKGPKPKFTVRVEIYLKRGSDISDASTFTRLDSRITNAAPGDGTSGHAYAYVVVIEANSRIEVDLVINLIKEVPDVMNVVEVEPAS